MGCFNPITATAAHDGAATVDGGLPATTAASDGRCTAARRGARLMTMRRAATRTGPAEHPGRATSCATNGERSAGTIGPTRAEAAHCERLAVVRLGVTPRPLVIGSPWHGMAVL